jgi:hypothetical protein
MKTKLSRFEAAKRQRAATGRATVAPPRRLRDFHCTECDGNGYHTEDCPKNWDGLCLADKHGLDFKGQECNLCRATVEMVSVKVELDTSRILAFAFEIGVVELGEVKAYLRASGCVLFVDVDGARVRIDLRPAVRAALRLAGVRGA